LLAVLVLAACDGRGSPEEARASDAGPSAAAVTTDASNPEARFAGRSQDPSRPPLDINLIGYDQGSPDAPIKIIEVSDFGCGYCRVFNQEIFPEIEKEFIETGIVQWKFVPFVLGMFPNGDKAAMAAECSAAQGADAFLPMRGRLFAEQEGWRQAQDPDGFFTQLAGDEGLDEQAFSECLVNGERQSQVELDIRLGKALGTRGTPAFIVQGVPVSGLIPMEGFRQVVEQLLAEDGEPSRDWLPLPPTFGRPSIQSQVLGMGMGHGVGPEDAPIQIIEFSDFGCGYCRIFQEQTRPVLDEEYVATGKVRWTYVPFVLGMFPNGDAAAVASECAAEQGRFDPMRRRLYQDQQGWRGSQEPGPFFTQLAEEEGLDAERFAQCLEEDSAPSRIQENNRVGQSAGIRGTPAFFINGFPVNGAQPIDTFRDILDIRLSSVASGGS
jgi:protein-disulfide isomerase